jgi:hypothetical protein
LLVEDEQDSRQLFARQRVSYDCDVSTVSRDEPEYDVLLDKFQQRFGNVIDLLRSLPDFILFKLRPYQGRYVVGFGKAYQLSGDVLMTLEHIDS